VVTLGGTAAGAFADKNVGTGKAVTVTGNTISGADAGNYNLIQQTGLTASITQADLTVSANNDSRIYGGVAYSGGNGVAYSGFVGGENSSALGGTLGYAGTSQGAKNAGSYVITPAGLVSSNYAVSFADGSLRIFPAPLLLTAVTNSKSFDGNADAQAIPLVAGLKGSDTVTNLTEVYADASPGSGKTLVVKGDYVIGDGSGGANYTATLVGDASGEIRALPVAVLPPVTPPAVAPSTTPAAAVIATEIATFAPVTQGTLTMLTTPVTVASNVNATSATSSNATPANPSGNSSPGVNVSIVQQATTQAPGLLAVQVPAGSSTSSAGLSIALPQSLFTSTQQVSPSEKVTLPLSKPLPSWIRYDAVNKILILGAVPGGALPMTVWVTLGDQTTVVQISESDAKR
jgi:hypothetical protein